MDDPSGGQQPDTGAVSDSGESKTHPKNASQHSILRSEFIAEDEAERDSVPSTHDVLDVVMSQMPREDSAVFEELMTRNEQIARENRLFESFLQQFADGGGVFSAATESTGETAPMLGASKQKLTVTEKYGLALRELQYRENQLEDFERKANDDIALLKSIIEGARIRINELKKESYEFRRDVVVGGVNPRTGAICAEKVIRFVEDHIRQKLATQKNYLSRNKSLRETRRTLQSQVNDGKSQGESKHRIDFHQLRIKSSQNQQKIKEKTREMVKLKMRTTKIVQQLNETKKALADILAESRQLRQAIKQKDSAIEGAGQELMNVAQELREEKAKNKRLRGNRGNQGVPQILDYVNQKSASYELDHEIRSWTRKVEIATVAAQRATKQRRKAARAVMNGQHRHNLAPTRKLGPRRRR